MRLLKALNLDDLIFLDIETVAATPKLTQDNPLWQAWEYKMRHGREPIGGDDIAAVYNEQASLFAEFGKIVCITIGKIVGSKLKLKSYINHDEKLLLQDFCNGLNAIVAANKNANLAGHAIKGFDIPWIVRRCYVNHLEVPFMLDTAGKKPWEVNFIDTMELWKGTGFNGGSLIAISTALGLSNPKDDIEGFQTTGVYYNEPETGLQRIATYCEKDVLTVANVVLTLRNEPIVTAETSSPISAEKVPALQQMFNTKTVTKKQKEAIKETLSELNPEEQAIAKELLNIVTA